MKKRCPAGHLFFLLQQLREPERQHHGGHGHHETRKNEKACAQLFVVCFDVLPDFHEKLLTRWPPAAGAAAPLLRLAGKRCSLG
jgi:hypothetical protein